MVIETGKTRNVTDHPEISPHICGPLIFNKGTKLIPKERTVFSTNGAGTTGHPQARRKQIRKERTWTLTSYHI